MFEEYAGSSPQFVSWKDKIHGIAPKPNHLYFTKRWNGNNAWVSDKYFEIVRTMLIDYRFTYTIPGNDYVAVDLSNATSGLNLYPETTGQLNEILIGFKPGNYTTQIDIPSGKALASLSVSSMIPSPTDATFKYLNSKPPESSPESNPSLKFWAIKDMEAIVLKLINLGAASTDYEKMTFVVKVARHVLEEIPAEFDQVSQCKIPPFEERQYTTIPHMDELRF